MKLRKNKLIDPRLQLKFAAAFACTAGLAALVQAMVLSHTLSKLSLQLPSDGQLVRDRTPALLASGLGWTLLLLVPLATATGVLMSFKLVGPLHRFKVFLRDVIAGRRPADCRIRKDDELHDVCALLNEATAPLREAQDADGPEEELDRAA